MSQISNTSNIRIQSIELQNFKGVKNGIVEFNCLKNPIEKDIRSDILGIYGQNGSGKTTLLEALHVAKLAMMGGKIPYNRYKNIISQGSDFARMKLTFLINNGDDTFYNVEYSFSLGNKSVPVTQEATSERNRLAHIAGGAGAMATGAMLGIAALPVAAAAGIVAGQLLKSSESSHSNYINTKDVNVMVVFDEVLNMGGNFNGNIVRMGPIFDTRSTDIAFVPKARHKSFFPVKTASALKELQRYKERALFNSRSFIFGPEVSEMLLEQNEKITEYGNLILLLKAYSIENLRILDSRNNGAMRDDIIPLYTANRGVGIKKSDSTSFLDDQGLKTLQVALKSINTVLKQLIPGLTLEAVKQVDADLYTDKSTSAKSIGTKVTVYSVRDNIRIPLNEESNGIQRLVSFIGLFSYAFVNEGVTVAIDEIDAGVYEYLLGELLLIFEEYGCGQLIFTSHNLRPMEVLDKKFIYFTTTNSDNRYIKPKSIRNENNLRDVYLREIIQGGQEEDLYSATKHGKIAAALQKAGDLLGEE